MLSYLTDSLLVTLALILTSMTGNWATRKTTENHTKISQATCHNSTTKVLVKSQESIWI